MPAHKTSFINTLNTRKQRGKAKYIDSNVPLSYKGILAN